MIGGMQKLMRFVAERFAEEFAVKGLDFRVFMRLADGQVFIDFVESRHAFFADGVRGADRLSASADAAAGAGHDFDEVVRAGSLPDLLHDDAGVPQGMSYGDTDFPAVQRHGAFLDSVESADIVEVEFFQCFAGDFFVDRAQGRFHDAACGAEDRAGAGAGAERAVKVALRQIAEGKTDVFDELDELARGEDDIDVLHAVASHFRPGGFKFLGGTRHDGHGDDLADVDAGLFRIICFGDGAEHAHGGFCRGQMVAAVREMLFHIVDPAGTAGGHHGQGAAVLQAVEEFRAFFHDREVGAEVGVEYLVEAQKLQRRDHLSGYDGTRLHAEGIAEGDADGRGDLYDDMFLRILQGVEYFLRIVLFDDRAGRADQAALAAEDAVRSFHRFVERRGDDDVAAASGIGQGGDALHVLAGADAASAADAFRGIAHDGRIGFDAGLLFDYAGQRGFQNVEPAAEALQVAVLIARAAQAVFVMVGQHQLEDGDLRIADDLRVGMDVHAFPDFGRAGREQTSLARDLDGAETAVRFDALVFMVAEMRDIDSELLRRLHDFRSFRNFKRDIVDGQMNHRDFLGFVFSGHYSAPPISNTSGNASIADCRVFCAVSPSPHREDMLMTRAMVAMMRISSRVAVWLAILSKMILI